jgi:hypothetical protein
MGHLHARLAQLDITPSFMPQQPVPRAQPDHILQIQVLQHVLCVRVAHTRQTPLHLLAVCAQLGTIHIREPRHVALARRVLQRMELGRLCVPIALPVLLLQVLE